MTRKAAIQFEGQGAMFTEEVIHSGETDPLLHTTTVHFEAAPEGVYPSAEQEVVSPIPGDPDLVKAVHEAVKTQNRREGQLGKHSPLQRDGSYLNVRLGDVLPQFGPVTKRNFELAKVHAQDLEQDRLEKRY